MITAKNLVERLEFQSLRIFFNMNKNITNIKFIFFRNNYAYLILCLFFVIAVFGDLIKRYFSDYVALGILYGFSGIFLVVLFGVGVKEYTRKIMLKSVAYSFTVIIIIFLYFIQILFNPADRLFSSIVFFTYLAVPLIIFLNFILRDYNIEGFKLALIFSILMMPHHLVGIFQIFFDQNFLISRQYSEGGGIIIRGFLMGEAQNYFRFPALFVSADRYAGMCAVQLAVSAYFLPYLRNSKSIYVFCLVVLVFSALLGSLISGVRSRMLIGYASFLFGVLVYWVHSTATLRSVPVFKNKNMKALLTRVTFVSLGIGSGIYFSYLIFDSVKILAQSLIINDFKLRMHNYVARSFISEDTPLVGIGMGGISARPSEFALQSLWIESGLVFGIPIAVLFAGLIILLVRSLLQAAFANQSGDAAIILCFTGFLAFGLLAGFSTNFELSMALSCFPIAAIAISGYTKAGLSLNVRSP